MSGLISLMSRRWIAYLLILIQISLIVFVFKQNSINSLLDNAIDLWFDKNDPTIEFYKNEQLRFGKKTWVIIALELDANKKSEWLSAVNSLSLKTEGLRKISRVLSPTNFEVLQQDNDYLEYKPVYNDSTTYKTVLNTLNNHPIAGGLLTSVNQDSLWFILAQESSDISSGGFERQDLIKTLGTYIEEQTVVKRFALTGPTVINAELNKLSWNDFLKLMPFTILLASLTLFILLSRSIRLAIPLLFVTGLSTTCALSAMLLFGFPFNMMTISLPGLVFVLGLASGIHLLHKFKSNPDYHVEDITQALWRPMLTSHLTTSAGFFSLSFIAITPVQVMAIFGTAGVLIALVNSLLVLPHILVFSQRRNITKSTWGGYVGAKLISSFTFNVFSVLTTNNQAKRLVYFIICIILLIMVAGLSSLKFDSTYLNMVSDKAPMKKYYKTLDEFGSYSANLSVLFNNKNANYELNTNDLDALIMVKHEIEKHPAVLKVVGPSDIYHEISPFFPAESNSNERVNDIFAFSITGGSVDVADYITADFSHLRLQVFFKYMQNSELKIFINNFLHATLDKYISTKSSLDYKISGLQVLWVNMDEAVYNGQLLSALIMLLVACVTFGLMLKKVRLTLIAVFINVVPILVILALFGLFKINIDMATVFILGISVGIAIDDTTYFVYGFKVNRQTLQPYQAIKKTLTETAPPIITTTLIIFVGFIVLVQSSFIPMQKFGLFVAIGIAVAMLADLFLLPYLAFQVEKGRGV